MLCAIAAGLETDFCSRAAAATGEDRELSFLPSEPELPPPADDPPPPDEDLTQRDGYNCDRSDDVRSASRDLRDGVDGPRAESLGGDDEYDAAADMS